MKKFFKNFLNDKCKDLKWFNTNFCYITTITFSLVLIICYFCFLPQIDSIATTNNFWNIYLMSFSHSGIVHLIFNVIMFILLSLLLERHFGSFTYFIMLILIIPLANITYFAVGVLRSPNDMTPWSGCGESCVNSFLMGMYLIVIFSHFKQYFLSKRIFLTLIPYILCIFFFSVDSSKISSPSEFFAHPSMTFMHAFRHNISGHFAPFIVGLVVSLLIYIILLTNKFHNKN